MYEHVICHYLFWTVGSSVLIEATNYFASDTDQCTDICSDSFLKLPKETDSQKECERGCRFLNIIDLAAKKNLSDVQNDCHKSCAQSYIVKVSRKSCIIGCDVMIIKKRKNGNHYVNPYQHLDQYITNDQEFESIENDVFLDPLIRQQVQQGYDINYKIPEAYIRTLPVDSELNLISDISYKYNKNNAICSSLISFIIFGTVLIGFMICVVKIIHSVQAIESRAQILTYLDRNEMEELISNTEVNEKKKIIDEKANDKNSLSILV